jgi:hypothetical protein
LGVDHRGYQYVKYAESIANAHRRLTQVVERESDPFTDGVGMDAVAMTNCKMWSKRPSVFRVVELYIYEHCAGTRDAIYIVLYLDGTAYMIVVGDTNIRSH